MSSTRFDQLRNQRRPASLPAGLDDPATVWPRGDPTLSSQLHGEPWQEGSE